MTDPSRSTEPTPALPRMPVAGIEEVAPAPAVASPCQLDATPAQDVPFWLPSWQDSLKELGWRWLLVLPAVAFLGLIVAGYFLDHRIWTLLWYLGIKIIVLACALPVVLMMEMARNAARGRRDPFCIHCGYDLMGLPDNYHCPECGRPYTFAVIEEYRRDPRLFIQRWKTHHQMPSADVPFAAGTSKRRKSKDGT
jgi:hypothetical protein